MLSVTERRADKRRQHNEIWPIEHSWLGVWLTTCDLRDTRPNHIKLTNLNLKWLIDKYIAFIFTYLFLKCFFLVTSLASVCPSILIFSSIIFFNQLPKLNDTFYKATLVKRLHGLIKQRVTPPQKGILYYFY